MIVSSKDEPAQYPRWPLRIMWGERQPDGMYVDGERVVSPDEDDYEDVYNQAILMHHECGDPMPYADARASIPTIRRVNSRWTSRRQCKAWKRRLGGH